MKNFFKLVTGLVIGSAVTYVVVKDKCEKMAQEEVDCELVWLESM